MIEASLEKIGAQLERIADALEGYSEGITALAQEAVAEPSKPNGKDETAETQPRKPASKATTHGKITREQIHEKLTEVVETLGKGSGRDAVKKILKDQGDGATGMKNLDTSHYKAVFDTAQDLLDA